MEIAHEAEQDLSPDEYRGHEGHLRQGEVPALVRGEPGKRVVGEDGQLRLGISPKARCGDLEQHEADQGLDGGIGCDLIPFMRSFLTNDMSFYKMNNNPDFFPSLGGPLHFGVGGRFVTPPAPQRPRVAP